MRSKLSFGLEWDSADGVQGPELQSTWSTLRILLNDFPISQLVDHKSGSVKDYINLPAYPLAEWIALNWWFLNNEPYTSNKDNNRDYASRHDIMYARDGYALPSLSIQPTGRNAVIRWKAQDLRHHRVQFVKSGESTITKEELVECLGGFVDKTIRRLETKGMHDTLLQQEWEAIQTLSKEERIFCETTSLLGLDPFSIAPEKASEIAQVSESLPNEIVIDFFSSCNSDSINEDAQGALNAVRRIQDDGSTAKSLVEINARIRKTTQHAVYPWIDGYEAAKDLRNLLGLNGQILRELDDLNRALKFSAKDFESVFVKDPKLPRTIAAVCGTNKTDSPVFVFHPVKQDERLKFAYCRSLYNYLFTDQSSLSLVTGSDLEGQKGNRAFAAEFLVPANSLRKLVKNEAVGPEEIDEIAADFKVSPMVIEHQIENHRIAQVIR
jgi:hypothetical protein